MSEISATFPLTTIPDASKASTSPSSHVVPASSSRSWKYDVFLSFRGEDTRKTFVDHLYSALVERVTCTYKDDVTLPRGDTIGPSLFKAIEGSQIAIIVFSENYANSSWCLDELTYIMKCNKEGGKIVMPIFYHVDPSDVRNQNEKYGEAFAKHETGNNNNKVESWRKALVAAGNIAGWEINHNVNGYEAKCIKEIVGTILDKLLYQNSVVDENLIGMGTRLQDLKSQLQIGSGGVHMVGIWGIGGGGKTTLASSLYIEISDKFDSCCFLENIKEESSMKTLQEKILSTVLKIEVKVESVDIGKQTIKTRLCCKNVLLLLDDIDDLKQLEALAGSHDWFGDGSRILITTRDKHLLRTHRVDKVSHVSLLSNEEATRLFKRCAYNETKPIEDYKTLSQRVVSYAGGLPLGLIVLGSFLYDKDKDEWISTLDRLKYIPELRIVEKLRISYDGLEPLEKELFLDIACFWRGKKKDEAMVMLDACGFHPLIGIKVLIQKALITTSSKRDTSSIHDVFDMHDLVQEMGHYIVRGEHPNNPEKHSRLWLPEEIEVVCSRNATMENNRTEAIICSSCPSGFGKIVSNAKKLRLLSLQNNNERNIERPEFLSNELRHVFWTRYPSRFGKIVSKVKNLRFRSVDDFHKGDIEGPEFLSNEMRYMYWERYQASPFPESFQPRKLVVLKLDKSLQNELWRGYKSLPCLKELHLSRTYNLVRTPDFGGLPCLEKFTLEHCDKLKEIHLSLGNHTNLVSVYVNGCRNLRKFPTIVQMGKLEILDIYNCQALSKFPKIEGNMESLVNLSLVYVGIKALPSTVGKYCTMLRSLVLKKCLELKRIEANFHALKHLHKCIINGWGNEESIKLPKDLFHEHILLEELHLTFTKQGSIPHLPCFLTRLTLSRCGLGDGEIPCDIGGLSNLQELDLSWNFFSRLNFSLLQLTQLKLLNLDSCWNLVELPELPTSIAILKADWCDSLEVVGDIINKNCKWLCQVSLCSDYWLGRSVINGGDRLLETMLQGNAIKNGCMTLQLGGVEITKGCIIPRLVKGNRYRLALPENWYNHYSGFLLCAAVSSTIPFNRIQQISMKHDKGGSTIVMDSQHNVFWQESAFELEETWVSYISFGLLEHTTWWDTTSTAIEFSLYEKDYLSCNGLGVCLVSKTSETDQFETATTHPFSQSSNDYKCNYKIMHDSESSHLNCIFHPYLYPYDNLQLPML